MDMEVFHAAIKYYKQNGAGKFVLRVMEWIPEYLIWKRAMIRGYLYDHIEWYRLHVQLKYLNKDSSADQHIVKFRKIKSGMNYCRMKGQAYDILNSGEKIEVVEAKSFEEREEVRQVFDSPPIYLTTFADVEIYGGTNLISRVNVALSDIHARNRENKYDIQGGGIICYSKKGDWIWVAYKDKGEIVEEAINCVGWACNNYFHFTFEILSRLVFVDDMYKEYRSLPILVDQAALNIPQMRDLLDRVNIYHHPIIPVGGYHRVHVKKLIYISRNLWMPPNFRPGSAKLAEDYMFSRSVADNIRKRVLNEGVKPGESVYKKIFLSRRQCKVQRLTNSMEIEQIFADNGYQIIFPEDMSFDEEVAVFNHADIIVGATGAAFTNIVFCREGTKIGIILPSTNDSYFFSNIANMVGVEFIVLGADIVKKELYSSLDTFKLNIDKCKRFIKFIEA